MDEQAFPRPLKFLDDQNDPLIAHFWSLVRTRGDPLYSTWLLAMNQVAAAHEDTAHLLPIGSEHPEEQRGVEFLGSSLNVLRVKPMDYLMDCLRKHAPDLTRVCGKFLQENLECVMLWDLRKRLGILQPPYRWRGEYLTADNPIQVGTHSAGHTTMSIPDEVSVEHLLELHTYIHAFHPAKRRGRPPKPPGAPRTRRPRQADPLATQAAALKEQGLHWTAIAQALWPDEPLPTEYKARERVRKRVERLVFKGRLDALP
jgi:hypothetical protein